MVAAAFAGGQRRSSAIPVLTLIEQDVYCHFRLLSKELSNNILVCNCEVEMTPEYSSERLRDLLHRKGLASERHRAAMASLLGMTSTEAAALAYLASSGAMTPGQLGTALGMTSGGVTALTNRLERNGHVMKEPHPTDRRSMLLRATPEVIEAAQERFEPLVSDMDRTAKRLSEQDLEVVGRYLEDVVAISERHAEELWKTARESDAARFQSLPVPGLWA